MPRLYLTFLLTIAALALPLSSLRAAELTVASFHPLITDLAKQVGGNRVSVLPILTVRDDPHNFEPTASDIKKMRSASLILLSGKGLEQFRPKLQDNLASGQKILEVGKKIPSIKVAEGSLFACCPTHSHGSIDPHWWHSLSNLERAAGILANAFTEADPAGKASYRTNAKATKAKLKMLRKWAKKELSVIPRANRKLVTAHAAFGYFCKEFGFRSIPVQGLNREREPSAKYLGQTIAIMKKEKVVAVFPETSANSKVLQEMVRATGAKLGGTLIADGIGSPNAGTIEGMFRQNVLAIVKALK